MTIEITFVTQVPSSEIIETQTNVTVQESPLSVSVVDENISVAANSRDLNAVIKTPLINVTLAQTPINTVV